MFVEFSRNVFLFSTRCLYTVFCVMSSGAYRLHILLPVSLAAVVYGSILCYTPHILLATHRGSCYIRDQQIFCVHVTVTLNINDVFHVTFSHHFVYYLIQLLHTDFSLSYNSDTLRIICYITFHQYVFHSTYTERLRIS